MDADAVDRPYHTGLPHDRAKPGQRGLTLIELLVALAVLVLMATWAVPGFQRFSARNEVAAEVLRIKTALALARNTAVTRRTTISVCPAPSSMSSECDFQDWGQPILIVEGKIPDSDLSGATLIRIMEGSQQTQSSFNRDSPIRFQPTGWSRGHNGTFSICGQLGQSAHILLNNMGRSRVVSGSCD